jgi:putative membrane protein
MMNDLKPLIKKQDKIAGIIIWTVSIVVFVAVFILSRISLNIDLGFNIHIFATINAFINGLVSLLLVGGFVSARAKMYALHRAIMFISIGLSVVFLLSYICHHLFSGSTPYGGNGNIRYLYFFILITHIFLAGIILPFILYTAYRALTGEYRQHRKLVRITFPIWLYVSITGVIVYLMISPYYK